MRRRFTQALIVAAAMLLTSVGTSAGAQVGRRSVTDPPAQAAGLEPTAQVSAGPGVYSPPEWLPVRAKATVGCVYSNCWTPNAYHGHWALDLVDPEKAAGDPIYPAGAGQARIRDRGTACGGPTTPANVVQVDHGGGVFTEYRHLNSISITEGQWVDPTIPLGTMGHTGWTIPCPPGSNHLHFAKWTGSTGIYTGTRVDPGTLFACHGSALVRYPQAIAPPGSPSWNSIPYLSQSVHSDGQGCVGKTTMGFFISICDVTVGCHQRDPDLTRKKFNGSALPTQIKVQLFDGNEVLKYEQHVAIKYVGFLNKFDGTAELNIPAGLYIVKYKLDNTLRRNAGFITVQAGKYNIGPNATLISGDIDDSNSLNIVDYQELLKCYSDLRPAKDCADPAKKKRADLDFDGNVNQFDYNLFLVSLLNQSGA